MTDHSPDAASSIAVVGMAGRFPGAADIDGLWRLLTERGDAIGPVPPDRWDTTAPLDPERHIQDVGGFLPDIGLFDPTFFGISPREAPDLDPQQRLMLEVAWQALEDAGRPAADLRGSRTGVYVGAIWHDYEQLRKERGAATTPHSLVGNVLDAIAARVSYFLQLSGPSLVVETGCSSSLVALHLAARALRLGEIEAAMVGGVNLLISPETSIGLTHFGGLSPTGRCHSFAASADGFVRGEGVVALYLKRLDRALADGDRIHGVIVHTTVNNDGGGKSLVTPNPAAHEALLRTAYAESGIPVDQVAYVEAHGTGTRRGDPIEATAIGRVLGAGRAGRPLPIGSVKSNIGHLEAASGLAGLVKVLLALRHRTVPPSLHCEEPNPEIDFAGLGLRVATDPLPLPRGGPLYAGLNSFGWGGTNAHVIVAPAPQRPAGAETAAHRTGPVLVPVSAHQPRALRDRAAELAPSASQGNLTDIADALAHHRDQFGVRAGFVAGDGAEAARLLSAYAADPGADIPGVVTGRARAHERTAFVFPGQGSQWAGMATELYAGDPVFAAAARRCAEALRPHVEWDHDPVEVVAGRAGDGWLDRLDMVQPVLWAVSVGLAESWRAAGVEPDVVVGHSQGEVSAATVAGLLSVEDAALIVARRSALVARTAGEGGMLAVELGADAARRALAGSEDVLSLAVVNGPRSCVLSGDLDALAAVRKSLESDGVHCRMVNVDYASHSPQMDALTGELLAALAPVRPRPGRIPLRSTVLARTAGAAELDAGYWVRNLRQPVLFAEAMGALLDEGVSHVVEISPHPLLVPAVEELTAEYEEPARVVSTLRRDAGGPRDFRLALAAAYVAGLAPFGAPVGKARTAPAVTLPGYPWQRSRFWVDGENRRPARMGAGFEVALLPSPGGQDIWHGTVELGTPDHPWLADHTVHGAVAVPGAAMLTLMLGAVASRTGGLPTALTDVTFRTDLTLDGEEPVLVGADWRDDLAEGGTVTLRSLREGTTSWLTHASAHVRLGEVHPASEEFPARLLEEPERDIPAFYADCAERGLGYGPSFRALTSLRVCGQTRAALGEVRSTGRWRAGARPGMLHPTVWDGALQTLLALDGVAGDGRAVVPTGVRRVLVHAQPDHAVTSVWSYLVRRDDTHVDVHLYDAGRTPLMTMEGLTVQALERTEGTPGGPGGDEDRLHRLEFRPVPPSATTAPRGGIWRVRGAGAPAGHAAALTEALRAAGAEVTGAPGGETAGLVYLAPRGDLAAQRAGLLELTELVRAAAAEGTVSRVVVVTAGAQAVADGDDVDPGAALFWGFSRVLRREHPGLDPLVLDVEPDAEPWAAVAAEALARDGEDQVVLRGGTRHAARLTRGAARETSLPEVPWRGAPQPFRLATGRPGFFDALGYRPLRRTAPPPGHLEIEVTAAGLNRIDVVKAMGTYPDPSDADVFGNECAGRVAAVGDGVAGFAVGDRAVAVAPGSLASHVTVRADHARPIPDGMDDADAAGVPVALLTAWYGLHDLARLEAGETVLIHSGTGGLGLAAIGVARALGARVIATAGSAERREYLRAELGVEHVFDSRELSWAGDVREVTGGRGVEVVLNSLTGAAIGRGLEALAEDGRFIEVGKTDIWADRSLGLGAFRKRVTFATVDLAGVARSRPERMARLLGDVWDRVTTGRLSPLPTTRFPFAAAADALRTMSAGHHIGKFALVDPASVVSVAPQPLPFRADAGYLVSGGLGALGLSLAEFLAEGGAGALVLLGRSAPAPEAAARIAAMRRHGVRVHVVTADVADPAALADTLAGVRAQLPPLRGVIHAAAVLDDATIGTLRPESAERVLAPKVDGAVNLDRATREDPLDFFVLFSSMAALVGNAGQAAYAAGNAFLDALAVSRRRRGLPALSVQWGPFAEIGLAAADDLRGARLADRGMAGFPAAEAWSALRALLESGEEDVVGYAPLDLPRWFEANPETLTQATWQELRETSAGGGGAGGGFASWVRSLGPEGRQEAACEKVRELAVRVLSLEETGIERDVPFRSLGLDSLMSIELRNRLETAFGLKLPPTILWTCRNAEALAAELCRRLEETTGV
ncbi:SDR family NAD(P)-dependent oxidoreductase [Streptomyces sp. NPDC021212]|uniref:SDR family NAD(P)-dependent oxidoreductase n=1 Tax=Streptomyces sp. NPDC021212 TaxID=3365118 RepID=UPI0037A457EF